MDLNDKSIKVPGQYEITGTDTLSVRVDVDGKEEKCSGNCRGFGRKFR